MLIPSDEPCCEGLTTTPPVNWLMTLGMTFAAWYSENALLVNECHAGVVMPCRAHTDLNRCLFRQSADAVASDPVYGT